MPAIITESTFALPSVLAAVLSRPWSLRKCDTLWDHPLSSFLHFPLLPHSHLIWVWLGLLRFGLVCWFLLLSAAGALFASLLDTLRAVISSAQKVLPHGVNICDIIKRRSAWYDTVRDRQGGNWGEAREGEAEREIKPNLKPVEHYQIRQKTAKGQVAKPKIKQTSDCARG